MYSSLFFGFGFPFPYEISFACVFSMFFSLVQWYCCSLLKNNNNNDGMMGVTNLWYFYCAVEFYIKQQNYFTYLLLQFTSSGSIEYADILTIFHYTSYKNLSTFLGKHVKCDITLKSRTRTNKHSRQKNLIGQQLSKQNLLMLQYPRGKKTYLKIKTISTISTSIFESMFS